MKTRKFMYTPWFHGSVKPTLPGVYERNFGGLAYNSYWSGKFWCSLSRSHDIAAMGRTLSVYQRLQWRGRMEKP